VFNYIDTTKEITMKYAFVIVVNLLNCFFCAPEPLLDKNAMDTWISFTVLYCIRVFIYRRSTAMGKQRRFWFA